MRVLPTLATSLFAVVVSVCTASANSVINLNVTCNGDGKPTGFISTMVDYAGVQALWKLCDAQGGTGTVEAQITHSMDQRIDESAGIIVNKGTFVVRGVRLPAKMVGGKKRKTKVFSGMNGSKYVYRWTDRDRDNLLGLNAVIKRCDPTSGTSNPHVCTEWFEFGRQTFETKSGYVQICPTLHSYSLSVGRTVIGGITLDGGACQWKSI